MNHRTPKSIGIGEVAARFGLSADTVRYYERTGVLPRASRDSAGRRSYSEDDTHLLDVLLRLRDTGMPLERIASFTDQVARDPEGVPERLALLEAHRALVIERIATWSESLRVIDGKISDYARRMRD